MSKEIPPCIFESESSPLALDFHGRDGRVHGFPYGHLLHFLHEANPDAELQPNAPAEQFLLSFSTHDVILLGWRMKALISVLCLGRLASIHAIEARYYGLTKDTPFVCEITVQLPVRQ